MRLVATCTTQWRELTTTGSVGVVVFTVDRRERASKVYGLGDRDEARTPGGARVYPPVHAHHLARFRKTFLAWERKPLTRGRTRGWCFRSGWQRRAWSWTRLARPGRGWWTTAGTATRPAATGRRTDLLLPRRCCLAPPPRCCARCPSRTLRSSATISVCRR